ncbi:unnamed protein product, partial [Prorocentrum cordatum]
DSVGDDARHEEDLQSAAAHEDDEDAPRPGQSRRHGDGHRHHGRPVAGLARGRQGIARKQHHGRLQRRRQRCAAGRLEEEKGQHLQEFYDQLLCEGPARGWPPGEPAEPGDAAVEQAGAVRGEARRSGQNAAECALN